MFTHRRVQKGNTMSDFFQNGSVTSLHNLRKYPLEDLEAKIKSFTVKNPISLLLPSLNSELEGMALPRIVEQLQKVPYLTEIVIGLDAANKEEFEHAKKFFARLPQRHRVIWQRSPKIKELCQTLSEKKLYIGTEGKGRNVWLSLGYLLASDKSRVIAMHDCDILTYHRQLLARLVYPLADPLLAFRFSKGYYSRVSDQLNGRVSRLFITPLIRSLKRILGGIDYLDYIDSFRYPLSGEIAILRGVAFQLRLPSDWGLEIGTLNEIYRNYAKNQMCQVDILDNYDHKHQGLSESDPSAGLAKMTVDIAKSFYRVLASTGVVFTDQFFRTLKAAYWRMALDFIDKYHADAAVNGLIYERHVEEKAVEVFTRSIILSGEQFLANPMELPMIPSWNRMQSALPNFMDELYAIIEEENN